MLVINKRIDSNIDKNVTYIRTDDETIKLFSKSKIIIDADCCVWHKK